MSVVQMAKVKL